MRRGRQIGRGNHLPLEGPPSHAVLVTPEPEQEKQPSYSLQVEHDWEQAMRMVACEALSQEVIEAGISAA